MKIKLGIILSLTLTINVYSGSATWNLDPTSGEWTLATNWTPATVPNSTTDIATFGASHITSVMTTANINLASFILIPGAPSYSIATDQNHTMSFWDEGVRNDSGVPQTFTGGFTFNENSRAGDNITYRGGSFSFNDNASAGSALFNGTVMDFFHKSSADDGVFSNATLVFHDKSTAANGKFTLGATGGGHITLFNTPSGGNATFSISAPGISFDMWGGSLDTATLMVNGGGDAFSDTIARLQFSTTADHATLIANGGVVPGVTATKGVIAFDFGATAAEATLTANATPLAGATGGSLEFSSEATAADSNITVNGAAVTGDDAEGVLTFLGGRNTTAGNATIVATGGSNGGKGGLVRFMPNARGDTCRIELLGNSQLEMDRERDSDLTVGSLEGEGTVVLGGHVLIIGSNNLSTSFSGIIRDGMGVGAIEKIGTGTLTLSGDSSYTGATTVSSGILLVSNSSGSGTGMGAVSVNAGTLGGSGIMAGAVTVGTNTGVQAFLAPSKGAKKPATLTIQGALTLNDDSTCIYRLNTERAVSDEVIANGATIDNGARFSFRPSGNNALTMGQVFTVFNNTAATPIGGTFHNLPEGKILTVNGSNLQASYSGGDGNDLTLTVIP